MDCEAARALISQLIDGDLDDARAALVREHLLVCRKCASLERDLRSIAQQVAALGPCEPPHDMWQRIERRLDEAPADPSPETESRAEGRPEGLRRRRVDEGRGSKVPRSIGDEQGSRARVHGIWRARVGSALLGAALGAAAVLVFVGRQGGSPAADVFLGPRVEEGAGRIEISSDILPVSDSSQQVAPEMVGEARKELALAEERYRKAAERLADLVRHERAARPFAPAVAAQFDRNLKVIDDAIARCRELAQGAADDPWAHEILFAAYQRKIHFLEAMLAGTAQQEGVR